MSKRTSTAISRFRGERLPAKPIVALPLHRPLVIIIMMNISWRRGGRDAGNVRVPRKLAKHRG